MKPLIEAQDLIINHLAEGIERNNHDPVPDQEFFKGFVQGLKVSLRMIEDVKQNEIGKALRREQRELNAKLVQA